ncbi:hypothetical protein F7725_012483, partial [Dissostichus mawsoni]
TDVAVGQPVNHGAVIHYISTEEHLIVPVVEADAAPRVAGHVEHVQLSVAQDVCGLHSLHFVVPCPPSRTGSLGYLSVAEPGGRLEVVSVSHGIDLGAVDAHLLELMQTPRMVEVRVGGDGQQRVLPLRVFAQQPLAVDVVSVYHNVLVRAAQQPDVGPIFRLVESLLDPEESVSQRFVSVPVGCRHPSSCTGRRNLLRVLCCQEQRSTAMAGKGRGVGAFTFNIEALGIGRGSMPDSRVGPMPLFPNTDFKPVPLKAGEEEDYMLALKQEMRGTMQRLPHNIKCHANKAEVERYTERYLKQSQLDDANWTPDWSLLPKELMPQKKKVVKPDDGNPEKSDDETEKKKVNEGEEEEEIEAEEYDEEDVEEENDYIDSYFDNGEDFGGAGSDENVDGEGTY